MMANFLNTLVGNSIPLNRILATRAINTRPLTPHTSYPFIQSSIPHDLPIYSATKSISGTIYTAAGTPAVGVTVKLFRQIDDLLIRTGTTDSGGHYIFPRDANDTFAYYVLAYGSATSPQVHGVSDRGGIPA